MSSSKTARFDWLKEAFEKEFDTKVETKVQSNDFPKIFMAEEKSDFFVQIIKEVQGTPPKVLGGAYTDFYQVNVYLALSLGKEGAREKEDKIRDFLKFTLAGVDIGDQFLNTSRTDLTNYWFRLSVLEGV